MEMALQKVPSELQRCLVHGNPRMDNVLVNNQSISLIDFENTGMGSPYDDLSIVCSQLKVLQALLWFPAIPPQEALKAFLSGYRLEQAIEMAILEACIAIRLVELYREYVRKGGGSMAGIPILRRKLHSLVIEALA